MKIVCTKEEKKELIKTMSESNFCPFLYCEDYKDCDECIRKRIKWLTVKE